MAHPIFVRNNIYAQVKNKNLPLNNLVEYHKMEYKQTGSTSKHADLVQSRNIIFHRLE